MTPASSTQLSMSFVCESGSIGTFARLPMCFMFFLISYTHAMEHVSANT